MKRKLAVPIAVNQGHRNHADPLFRKRMLRLSDEESEDYETLAKIAENRVRIDALLKQVEEWPAEFEEEDSAELDYLEATIQLGLLEITGELEDIPYSDELFDQAVA